jgi:AcrR family transcriptional regulator
MTTRRARKLQVREALIIGSAARLIDRVGYTAMTMDMLAEEAGIAKPTLYQHFSGKHEVMIGSTLRALDNLEAFIAGQSGPAAGRLAAVMRFMMRSGHDPDGFPRMVMHDEVLHLFARHTEVAQKFQRVNAQLFRLVADAQAEGDIAPDLPPEIVITMMMNNIQAASASAVYPHMTMDMLVEMTIRIFFKGLKA